MTDFTVQGQRVLELGAGVGLCGLVRRLAGLRTYNINVKAKRADGLWLNYVYG
eukprot:COSAG05_NODE_3388_length_2091_cov_1.236948_2_plen_53_part_00